MSLPVEVISTKIVKPSSPTPQHLRHFSLSFIDQIVPQISNCMVYFFNADDIKSKFSINEASDLLKKSLSQVLTHFHPLAGRIKAENLIVDCNDEGVPYIETQVRCNLSHATDNPSPANISKLLPYEADEVVDTVLGVQFNVFDCGGIAIGVCICHKIADAMSFFQFIKSWAAMAFGEPEQIRTHFQSSSLFPPKKDMPVYINNPPTMHKIVCKRFVFEASVLESLRTKYSRNPTSRATALTTFIWTRFVAATMEEGNKKIHLVGCTANLRPRMNPPLPEYAFGNYAWYLRTFPTLDEEGECNNDLPGLLREQVNKIDNDFIVRIREGREWNFFQNGGELASAVGKGEMVMFSITSLCRFPVYEVDFGWGKPTLAVPTIWKFKNLASLNDTKSGGGIVVHVSLAEDDMAKFERDVEVLAHVSTRG